MFALFSFNIWCLDKLKTLIYLYSKLTRELILFFFQRNLFEVLVVVFTKRFSQPVYAS